MSFCLYCVGCRRRDLPGVDMKKPDLMEKISGLSVGDPFTFLSPSFENSEQIVSGSIFWARMKHNGVVHFFKAVEVHAGGAIEAIYVRGQDES